MTPTEKRIAESVVKTIKTRYRIDFYVGTLMLMRERSGLLALGVELYPGTLKNPGIFFTCQVGTFHLTLFLGRVG